MTLASEASISSKIERMDRRIRRGHGELLSRGIDQTRLVIEGSPAAADAFSFLVLGDSGSSRYDAASPQRQVAELLFDHQQDVGFVLHTGDLVYLVGSSEQYPRNFIRPYREWLVGGEHWRRLRFDAMTFRLPFLPVPGNHDYYDLSRPLVLLAGLSNPVRRLWPSLVFDVGSHGSHVGEAYARAFLDGLALLPEEELAGHLDRHYRAELDGRRCLAYRPGQFTRLPNRYYHFRWAGVDVFALDSNTLHQDGAAGEGAGGGGAGGGGSGPEGDGDGDARQKEWLLKGLVASWRNPDVRGRILVLHHPPYASEVTKWREAQTLAVRRQLREVLDQVAAEVGAPTPQRPLLNLVLTGHAHCLELMRSGDTGHGDSHIPWLICGGGGYSLRRQRPQGGTLLEGPAGQERPVAHSELFVGRSGHGAKLRRRFTALRVDAAAGSPLKLTLRPLVSEKVSGHWRKEQLAPIRL